MMVFAWLAATGASAQTTNSLSDAEIQGLELAHKILTQQPPADFTNTAVLQIHNRQTGYTNISVQCEAIVTATNWESVYEAFFPDGPHREHAEIFRIIHDGDGANRYEQYGPGPSQNTLIANDEATIPFAGSDFWLCDLGLEFFHWPMQKLLKHDVHRSRGCSVLESTNPNPIQGSYSRVVSWVDDETLGIVEAYAYDAKGKRLKDFYPKDFKKVNGQWEVQTLIMENVQTGSRSRLEFDLKNE